MTLSILYRGPLSSCNYGCRYCPFAKRRESREMLGEDERALARFVAWARRETHRRLSVFFTPWGEALTRRWYREAIVALSRELHVERVAIQTNLSAPLAFLDRADPSKVGLWCTYHPEWADRARFVAKIRELARRGISHSVGVVGMRRFLPVVEALRGELPEETYL